MSTPTFLEKQILATVVYYDILDHPLTNFEVFLYLVKGNMESRRKSGVEDGIISSDFRQDSSVVWELLNNSEYLKKYIGQKLGFYFLKKQPPSPPYQGGIDIVEQRLDRKKLADQKWKKIKKIFWIMQVTPFMKMVLVSGSLALGNSKKESDIDIIITAKKGRIWTVRTIVTFLTSILGVRRYKNKTKNKICLNHYITDKSLKIPFESLYNAQSYLHLINVYDNEEDKKLFRKFQEENKWIGEYVQNYEYSKLGSSRSIKRSRILGFISGFFEFVLSGNLVEAELSTGGSASLVCRKINLFKKFGNYFEKKLSQIQSERIKKDKLYEKSGGRITISNNQLEFHPSSHEANIIPEFNRRMKELKLFEFEGQKDSGLNT
ncbi:MAG: hypothetical protein KAQ64_00950 [Candidatus Pacebacteria bacterium]|nr:hypothetical protein [Candidatus Paceibacterota bacterium]